MESKFVNSLRAVLLVGILLGIWAFIYAYQQVGPSLRCLVPSTGEYTAGLQARSVVVEGQKRCFWLYLPQTFTLNEPLPIVFSFHGFSSSPYGQMTFSGWNHIADQEGFAVVYPQGSGSPMRWDTIAAINSTEGNDAVFFEAMLADLNTHLGVEPGSIFVTGFSNGGAMTLRLICELGDHINAAGTVAAPVPDSLASCLPEKMVPLMSFHGTADPVVPFNGQQMYSELQDKTGMLRSHFNLLAFLKWTRIWADIYQCAELSEISSYGDGQISAYQRCANGTELVIVVIEEGGHTWPGGENIPFVGKTSRDIDASKLLWSFFQTHFETQ
jgi:polyhydroxybutyrate depolymerase